MPEDPRIRDHVETVHADWVDYNGHMNVAYYVLIFDHATDLLLDRLEIGKNYVQTGQGMVFVVESHITYDRELMKGQKVRILTQLLSYDLKRLRFYHEMWTESDHEAQLPILAATLDSLALHVDAQTRRVVPWPEDRIKNIASLTAEHALLPIPQKSAFCLRFPRN